jgi:hypothetical protein
MTISADTIPVLGSIGELGKSYSAWLVDIWGVMHNGVRAFPAAVEATRRFREQGGIVEPMHTQCHAYAFFTSVCIHQYRKIVAGIFKQERFATIGRFADSVRDLCNFELRIHICFYSDQFARFFQSLNKFLLILICHWEILCEVKNQEEEPRL